jgi:hypothetical protein
MKIEEVYKVFNYCSAYLDKLNDKQINALWEYINMMNRHNDYDLMKKEFGRVAILSYFVHVKMDETKSEFERFELLSGYWKAMVVMLLVQDEYNINNPNYKSKLIK